EQLTQTFTRHVSELEHDGGDIDEPAKFARRELRAWIKRKLLVERDGQLMATDALQRCVLFVESLEDESMTSTASRLSTVQRAIENLSAGISSNQEARCELLQARIDKLQSELADVRRGDFEVLEGPRAIEEIREVYQLAVSLRSDFRRVEDSFRAADRTLRENILNHNNNRGQIVDELLSSNAALLETVEGQVFDGFYQQLIQSAELELMKSRLQEILANPVIDAALSSKQKSDLRRLVGHLLAETQRVIQARAHSERDVKGFLKSGFAEEQFRVGSLVQDILRVALAVDWNQQSVRRTLADLPPVAVDVNYLPLPARLQVKQIQDDDQPDLDLENQSGEMGELPDEFWYAYNTLDRETLFHETMQTLRESDAALTIGELAARLPPTHDLETLCYWLALAREAGVEMDDKEEAIDVHGDDSKTRFYVPLAPI
ncbi:MAG: DUF3375 family protein, partial [Planctomycetota bacterium]